MMETTNNRMELMAVVRLLEHVEIGTPLRVFSDSEYVVKGLTTWCRELDPQRLADPRRQAGR